MAKSEQLNDIESILSHLSHFATNEDIAKKNYLLLDIVKSEKDTL